MAGIEQEQPKKRSIRSGIISFAYDGVLAENLVWRSDMLWEYQLESDARTAIEITNGHLQRRRRFSPQTLSVETDTQSAKALITIDDQQLRKNALRNGQNIDEEKFAKDLEKITKKGLKNVLAAEKIHQIETTLKSDALFASAMLPLTPGLIYLLNSTSTTEKAIGIVSLTLGYGATYVLAVPISKKIVELRHGENPNYYQESSDLVFPTKHLESWIKGRRFLGNKETKILELNSN